MRKNIRNLLLANLLYFPLVIAIYAFGYEYDKANKIYPESVQLSYDTSMGNIYGQRWVRFLQIMISVGVTIDVVIGFIFYIQNKSVENKISILNK